ncbi:hypothetical protein Pcinc_035851 [Petrolisthes cinctipes]|uniref:MADF domain-containing protein n=1 Tax=Petrolisthes cinctipes TaxID=88211 RepID=A0AAE1EP60_PETCI|nr:hypothetical protein Pcinc_035851 [Petrolisthes cinctipes]
MSKMTSNEKWKWDNDETMSLIQQYERFPELWNVSLIQYRNKEKKPSAIKEIAKTLNIPESEITRKWHNLRCQMNSETKKIKKKKSVLGTDDVTVKSMWEFYDAVHLMIRGCNTTQGNTTSVNMNVSSSANLVNDAIT